MKKVALKYRKPLKGVYNKGIYKCPECKTELLFNDKYGLMYSHIIGFAEAPVGNVAMIECPECFTVWYFHSRIECGSFNTYDYFLETVKSGENKHFNK